MVTVTFPAVGRGSWNTKGVGGTLSTDGKSPGSWFAPAADPAKMIGKAAKAALATGTIDANLYAVFLAVKAIQRVVGATEDGLYGKDTAAAVALYQSVNGLGADGVWGVNTGKRAVSAALAKAATAAGSPATARKAALGHTTCESTFDIACVGPTTPKDRGPCQINADWHADVTFEQAFDLDFAADWQVRFVQGNIAAMSGNVSDGIAAYLLGVGGARSWVAAGRPASFRGADVAKYVADVREAGGL